MPGIYNLLVRDVMKKSVSVCVRVSLPPTASNWKRIEKAYSTIPCGIVHRQVQGTLRRNYKRGAVLGTARDGRVIREG
jgi:hypothetical protein